METKQKYAFISYNHRDVKVAKWLHRKLESYKLPTEIHNEFEDSRYLRPVFRDQEDLNTGVLSDELKKHLESSKYLIVICSPESAQSEWVNNEVRTFIKWGRLEYIIPFIIDGTPNSGDERECFPMSLREYVKDHPDRELLGISFVEAEREKAFIRVISRMIGVSFDELWKRHERERRRKMLTYSLGTAVAILLLYYLAVPVTLTIEIRDAKHHLLMPNNALLNINGAEYPQKSLDTIITINNIPGYYRGKKLPVMFSATYYVPIKEQIVIGFGMKHSLKMRLERDSTFSVYAGTIVDDNGNPVKQADVYVGEIFTQTDSDGHFKVVFPTENQSENKPICIKKSGKKKIVRDDECPGNELKYIMHVE